MRRIKCRNCGNEYEGNFCNVCGQNADVKRFTLFYLLKESVISSLDIESGFFPTLKRLTLSPGESIREYLEGKRLSLYVPAKFLLIVGIVSTFLAFEYRIFTNIVDEDFGFVFDYFQGAFEKVFHLFEIDQSAFFHYANENTTVTNILATPIFALFSFLFFRGVGYNYAENLILNAYITAQQMFLLILFFPILEFFPHHTDTSMAVYTLMTIAYNYWVYMVFFKEKNVVGLLITTLIILHAYVLQFVLNIFTYKLLSLFNLV